jgi:hypothetical protein
MNLSNYLQCARAGISLTPMMLTRVKKRCSSDIVA